ncbi:hypothetical protein ACFQLX_21255, partial [Streptomyces polyrhachis]
APASRSQRATTRYWERLTTAQALATAGRWAEAARHLHQHRGVGDRMLDGRQIKILAHLADHDHAGARNLIEHTRAGDPWEGAVTAVLTLLCGTPPSTDEAARACAAHQTLEATAPGLPVFHTRLGLALHDALAATHPKEARSTAELTITRTLTAADGYTARDLLRHPGCRTHLTAAQERQLHMLLEATALDSGALPAHHAETVNQALDLSQQAIRNSLAATMIPSTRHPTPEVDRDHDN